MSIKKLIENLEEWHENAISELCADDRLTCDDLCGCRSDCIVLQAIKALRVLADQEDPAPLALEELRQRVEEPVWVQPPGEPGYGRWAIVEGVENTEEDKILYLHDDFTCHDYGRVWLAYRNKPKES